MPATPVNLRQRENHVTEWRGREALDAEVESIRRGIVSRYSGMLKDLMTAGVLTSEEAESLATPQLSITVDDLHTAQ
jgi:hypothetical protein